MSTEILGGCKFISILGAVTPIGVTGVSGFDTSIVTGLNDGKNIFGALIGLVTFKLIAGFTTGLGISIWGLIVISSFVTDFGRTFAMIWISTSGSCTCNNEANP